MKGTKDIRSRLWGVAIAVMSICMMFLYMSITSLAAEGKVITTSAKIRKEASTSSEAVGSAYLNETYDILNEVTDSDGYVWYQISYEEDKLGYIRSDLMQKSGSTTTTPPSTVGTEVTDVQPVTCTVTGSQVNVRSNASTSGDRVAQVRSGVVMTINGKASDSEGKTWYRVTFTSDSGDVTGFVRYDFVSVSGEILPVVEQEEPVETPPVADEPVVNEPVVESPVVSKNYDTSKEDGVWYLIDNVEGKKYNLEDVMDAAVKNPELYTEQEKTIKAQKGWITFFVILIILMSIVITLLVLKLKDVMDEAYFSAVEKDTIRQRQAQNGNGKNVMHTVGANSGAKSPARQGTPTKTSVPKMNLNRNSDGTPQTVKVSNPADTRAPKPVQPRNTERPVQPRNSEKPVQPRNPEKPVQPRNPERAVGEKKVSRQESKAVVSEETKVMPTVTKQETKKYVDNSKQTWQSKNFMTDEDDEMEYGFLDWDEGDE